MLPLLREIGHQLRQLIYDPNCEMVHRQETFSLVVLSVWRPVGGARNALSKRLRHESELTKVRNSAIRPSVFDRNWYCEKHTAF
jgi:hypothetical protein